MRITEDVSWLAGTATETFPALDWFVPRAAA
jgi:putative flavoprotein involved in K+ transport